MCVARMGMVGLPMNIHPWNDTWVVYLLVPLTIVTDIAVIILLFTH